MKLTCIAKTKRRNLTYELFLNGLNIDYLTSSKYSGDEKLALAAAKIRLVWDNYKQDGKKVFEYFRKHPDKLPEGVVLGFIRD